MDLNVASDQRARSVRIRIGFDAERIRGSRLAAVVDINGVAFVGRADWPDDRCHSSKCRVFAPRYRRAGRSRTADEKSIHRLGLDPDLRLMVVVLQVS